MCEWLGEVYAFRIITRDRDRGDEKPYEGYATRTWHVLNGAQVQYLPTPYWSPWRVRGAVLNTHPALLYFHSSLDPALTIVPLVLRRLGLLPYSIPVLVAPRGEFSPGALSLKRIKKLAFISAARWAGLYRSVIWHATSPEEADFIRAWWGSHSRIRIAGNLPAKGTKAGVRPRKPKHAGTLRLVFLSRISPKKNLLAALNYLAEVKAQVTLDIYGPTEDKEYWSSCQDAIAKLPSNIDARYRGCVGPDDVISTFSLYDMFIFPTLGENFGHVILEALIAGCPILVSDQTPWRGLSEKEIGFDLPLDRPHDFVEVLEQFAAMDDPEFRVWSSKAREYGVKLSADPQSLQATRALLDQVMLQ